MGIIACGLMKPRYDASSNEINNVIDKPIRSASERTTSLGEDCLLVK